MTALDLTSGQIRGEVGGVPMARQGAMFLLLTDSPAYQNPNGTALDLLVWNSVTMQTQKRPFAG